MFTNAEKQKFDNILLIMLIKGLAGSQPAWAFVALKMNEIEKMIGDLHRNDIDMSRYAGSVLAKGAGEEPSPEALQQMKSEYNFTYDYVPLAISAP